jgi:hypothetical protein
MKRSVIVGLTGGTQYAIAAQPFAPRKRTELAPGQVHLVLLELLGIELI